MSDFLTCSQPCGLQREVSDRLNAGETLPDDPPPSRVIQQATRLKEVRTWVLACKPGSYLLLLVACMLPVPVSQAHAAATKSPATTRPVFLALQLSRELRQFSSQGLPSITSPRTARQICRWVASLGMGRLGDSAVPICLSGLNGSFPAGVSPLATTPAHSV